jgi:hypothetical protein
MDRGSRVFFWAPGSSSRFPSILGTELDDGLDGSWRRCFLAALYLAGKPAHVGVDVDGLAYPMHCPTTSGCQTIGQGLLLGVVLSPHCSRVVALFRGMQSPRAQIFGGMLTVRVPAVLSYRARHSMLLLHEDPTPMVPT